VVHVDVDARKLSMQHFFHHLRGIALPFAVSSSDAPYAELKVSGDIDGCASLLSVKSSYFSKKCTNLTGVKDRRRVPTVSLETVLTKWLGGRRVDFAKIDAQGLDVSVIRSAGQAVEQLRAVQLEVVRDRPPLKCPVQYAGDGQYAKCPKTEAALAELGLRPFGTNCTFLRFGEAHGCEAQMTFVRPGEFDAPLVRSICALGWPHTCGPGWRYTR